MAAKFRARDERQKMASRGWRSKKKETFLKPLADFITRKPSRERKRTRVSTKMKMLWLVLFIVPHVQTLDYNASYQGFDNCGLYGWICDRETDPYRKTIIYDCSETSDPDARIWTWTARLPSKTQVLIIQNCSLLELHMDCTQGSRSSIINSLIIRNIRHLNVVAPTMRGFVLHDNAPAPHIPKELYLENIDNAQFFPGLFQKPPSECTYNSESVKKIVMENVKFDVLRTNTFNNTLETFHLKKIKVRKMEEKSISVTGDIMIWESTFPVISRDGLRLKGVNVTLKDNTINAISSFGITVQSYNFNFVKNKIGEIMHLALDVWSSHVTIKDNIIHQMNMGALERIYPSYYPVDYKLAKALSYSFVGNEIENLSPASLHINWEAYKGVCSNIVIERNKFNCSCENIQWFQLYKAVSNQTKFAGFYHMFLNQINFCYGSDNCTLSKVLPQICVNSTNIAEICAWSNSSSTSVPESHGSSSTEVYIEKEIKEMLERHEDNDATESVHHFTFSNKYYYQDQSDSTSNSYSVLLGWVIVLAIALITLLGALALYTWCASKRKKLQVINEIYKYDKNNDSDRLIKHVKIDQQNVESHSAMIQD